VLAVFDASCAQARDDAAAVRRECRADAAAARDDWRAEIELLSGRRSSWPRCVSQSITRPTAIAWRCRPQLAAG